MSLGVVRVPRSGFRTSQVRTCACTTVCCSRVACGSRATYSGQLAKPADAASDSIIVPRSLTITVSVNPRQRAVALHAPIPARDSSASLATLSLIVSVATARSRRDVCTSSWYSEKPTAPGARAPAARFTRSRGSRSPAANCRSASSITNTLITDAATTRPPTGSSSCNAVAGSPSLNRCRPEPRTSGWIRSTYLSIRVDIVEYLGERIVLPFWPDAEEVLVRPSPQQQRTARGHTLSHLRGHPGIVVGQCPAAVLKPAAGILVRATRRLHHAIERQAVNRDDSHLGSFPRVV